MDSLSNALVSIKNASMRFKDKVDVPYSKLIENVLSVLKSEGFISNYKVMKEHGTSMIRVTLKYTPLRTPVFGGFRRISKSSKRIYRGYMEMPRVKKSYGINIVSTSKGVMSCVNAKKEKIGGEVICQVW